MEEEKVVNSGRFQPGHKKQRKKVGESDWTEECGVPQRLWEMRKVSRGPSNQDRGHFQAAMRELFKKDVGKFMALLREEEKEYNAILKQRAVEKKVEEGAIVDHGTDKAVAKVEGLLDKIHKKEAAKNAELARRPDAANIAATLQNRLASAVEREKQLREQVRQLRGRVKELEIGSA
jgi:hypothetical protein